MTYNIISEPEAPAPPNDEISVKIVKENELKIKKSFAALVRKVVEKLETRNINMKSFNLYAVNLFPPGDFIPSASSVNVAEVFESISRNRLWNHLHYSPIAAIIEEFLGDDQELEAVVKSYRAELAGFLATTKIIDYIKKCNSDDDEIADPDECLHMARYDKCYCKTLTTKLNARVTEKSLDYIDKLWRSIAEYFCLPSLTVLLETIKEGCIEVTWLVPSLSAIQIQANIQDSKDFLRSHGIICMTLDEELLYTEDLDKVYTVM